MSGCDTSGHQVLLIGKAELIGKDQNSLRAVLSKMHSTIPISTAHFPCVLKGKWE